MNEHEDGQSFPPDAFEGVTIDPDVADLAALFLHSKRAEVRALFEPLERGDFTLLRQVGHNLAGSGGGYGFPRLSELGVSLSNAARAQNAMAVREVLTRLNAYLAAWTRRYG